MQNMNYVTISILMAATLTLFQNCGQVQFDEKSLSSDSKVSAAGVEDGEASGVITQDGEALGSDLVACILVDHGKSLKLGLVEGALQGVNAVSDSVCIKRASCLELVSRKFDVQGAYDRGYCAHNPNVVRLSDDELASLLN